MQPRLDFVARFIAASMAVPATAELRASDQRALAGVTRHVVGAQRESLVDRRERHNRNDVYLSDREIKALLPELGIESPNPDFPFDPERQIQPCSIDLRIASVFWVPRRRRRVWRLKSPWRTFAIDLRRAHVHDLDPRRDWKRRELGEGDVLTIKPGRSVMARIYERVRIPTALAGKIEGRSSYARLGLSIHCTGDFINPGWEGYMPLQLVNAGPYPIRITPYLPLCQLMLVKLSSVPERSYGDAELDSKYLNDDGGPSLWWRDVQVRKLQDRLGDRRTSERIQREVVELVRFEEPDVLERFERYVESRRLGSIDATGELADAFARQEDRRRIRDRCLIGLPALAVGAVLGSVFVPFGAGHAVLAICALASLPIALGAWARSEVGYLGRKELRAARNRPRERA